MDDGDDVDLTPDWDTETAFELAMGWHDEAERIALERAAEAEKRGYKDGAASWRRIAIMAAEFWEANKEAMQRTRPRTDLKLDPIIAAELLKPSQTARR